MRSDFDYAGLAACRPALAVGLFALRAPANNEGVWDAFD
jgi:hypothetical protein